MPIESPIPWAEVAQAMRQWVITSTGLDEGKVILSHQNAPRPQPPYAVINPKLAITRRGLIDEERLVPGQPGKIQRIGHRRISVSLNIYGANAIPFVCMAQSGLERYDVREALEAAAGLTVIDQGQVRDLTAFMETHWEERGQVDVIFGIAQEVIEDVGYIETVEYSGEFSEGETLLQVAGTISIEEEGE